MCLLWLASLTLHVFKVDPCYSVCQYFTLVRGNITSKSSPFWFGQLQLLEVSLMLNESLQKLVLVLLWTPEYPFQYWKIIFIHVSVPAPELFVKIC